MNAMGLPYLLCFSPIFYYSTYIVTRVTGMSMEYVGTGKDQTS